MTRICMRSSKIKTQDRGQGHVTSALCGYFKEKK